MGIKIRTVLRVVLTAIKQQEVDVHFSHVQFDPKNENVYGITNNGILYHGELATNKITVICHLKSQPMAFTLFSRNEEKYALIGLQNGPLVQINIDAKEVSGINEGFRESIKNISVNCESNRAITALQSAAIIWDISGKSPTALHRLTNSLNSSLMKAFFGHNSNTIITCFQAGNVISWDFPSLQYQAELNRSSEELSMTVELISVSEDLQVMSLFTADSKIILLDLTSYAEPQTLVYPFTELMQMEILTLWFEGKYKRVIIFLTKAGDLQFFDVDINSIVMEHSAKLEFYVKVAISNLTAEYSCKPIAGILNDGSLEVMNIKITTSNRTLSKLHINQKTKDDVVNVESQAPKATHTSPSKEQITGSHVEKRAIIRIHEFDNLLQKFGEFPEKYRFVIWKHLLELPSNQQSFATLLERGLHPAYANLEDRFPVTEPELLNAMKRILSAIAHWCSLFAEVDYLPQLLFPFIKVLHDRPLVCFEIILTYLVNWCQDWFLLYPAPPYQLLAQIDGILEKTSPKLLSHFKAHGVTAQTYAWPVLKSSLSEIFTKEEWLGIWDHVFTAQQPQLLHCIVAAYALASQNTLLNCKRPEEFQKYFQDKNPVSVKIVVGKAQLLQSEYETQLKKSAYNLHQFVPLTKETYPVFANFPLEVVENHAYQMKKLRNLEAEYLQRRKAVLQLEAEFGSIHEQAEEWRRKAAILKATEYLHRRDILQEEHRLQQQRSRLQDLMRELQAKEVAIMETKKLQLQHEHQLRSEANVARLKDTAHWMTVLRHEEFQEATESAEARNIKQWTEQCRYEMDLLTEDLKRNGEAFTAFYSHNKIDQDGSLGPIYNGKTKNVDFQPQQENEDINHRVENSEHLNLEKQLLKLEENNRNMELEIKKVLQQLETEYGMM